MANQSYPESVMFPGLSESSAESVIVPGLSESNQADLFDPEQTDTKPKLSVDQIVSILRHLSLALYLFGLFSNISILLVFFKDGFSSSTNIALFSLAVADLTVCVIYATALISKLLYYICLPCYAVYREFANIETVEFLATAIATYITAILCWERLCCIAYPMKVSFFLFIILLTAREPPNFLGKKEENSKKYFLLCSCTTVTSESLSIV